MTDQTLRYLEEGKTEHPRPDALRAIAAIYEVDYQELAALYIAGNYQIGLTIADGSITVDTPESESRERFLAVRLLEDKIAAGPPLIINESDIAGHLPFSSRWLERNGISKPLCLTVGKKERSMLGTINPGDIVLVDCSDERRLKPINDHIYAVNVPEEGTTLKRILVAERGLFLVADNPDKENYPTRFVDFSEDRTQFQVIVGQVMWKGQPL